MKDCIFCKIASKEISSKVIYEDDKVIAYLDISPISTGHTLIIPKDHYDNLDDIDITILTHILKVAKDLKKLLEEKLNIKGLKLVQNNGIFQDIKHFHLHLIPDSSVEKIDLDKVHDLLTK